MPLALQSIEGVTGRRAMAPRWRLSTLAGAFALAAMLAVAIPAAASAALVGSENGVTLAAGWNAATQSHQFWWPPGTLTSVPQVTYSINGFGHLTTIYGQDELTCKNNSANTVSKLSKAYSRRGYQAVTLTWLPPLACPAGSSPVADQQDAYAETIVPLGGGEVNYNNTWDVVFDSSVGPAATTTTLSIPSTVDTGWTATNPARVTAACSAGAPAGCPPDTVTMGTVTITVSGAWFCSYPAGAQAGCTLANLPPGTDRIGASYSGSPDGTYQPSSTSSTVTVLQVQPTAKQSGPGWAGYVDTSDTYTAASGSWTVPTANCGTFPTGDAGSSSATWVGIDGFARNPNVEQIGTDSNCVGYTGEYHAWWEMVQSDPVKSLPIPITIPGVRNQVSPGDSMSASVTATGTPGQYTLTITDNTQGWTFTTTQTNTAATGVSAECIEEQPDALSLPLTNFGTVIFTQCQTTGSNHLATPIWDHPNVQLTMNNGTLQAVTSDLFNAGKNFTVTWVHR